MGVAADTLLSIPTITHERFIMNEVTLRFIHENRIDSFQKLSFVLFLHRYAQRNTVTHEFARQLNFAGDPVFEEIIDELAAVGLIHQQSGQYALRNEPALRNEIDQLVIVYEDPTARQLLLGQLYRRNSTQMYTPQQHTTPFFKEQRIYSGPGCDALTPQNV